MGTDKRRRALFFGTLWNEENTKKHLVISGCDRFFYVINEPKDAPRHDEQHQRGNGAGVAQKRGREV